jgi:hypothetical protein
MKDKTKKQQTFTASGKQIIYAPAPPAKKKRGIPARQAIGGKPAAQRCPLCKQKTQLGELASHKCPELKTKVRVRKFSTLPRKQSLVKVKSHFQQKLSDESGGWY